MTAYFVKKNSGNLGFKSSIHSKYILALLCSFQGDLLCMVSFVGVSHFSVVTYNWTMVTPFNTLTKEYHQNLPKCATDYSVELLNKKNAL